MAGSKSLARALPDTRVFYAVKANPAPEVLNLLTAVGSCFDVASMGEVELVLKSRWVVPARLVAAGYKFEHPYLDETLRSIVAERARRP